MFPSVQTAVVCTIVFIAFWAFLRWRFARALPAADRGSLLGRRETVLDENGIREQSAYHRHQSDWNGVLSVEETDEHVFLMIDRFAGYIVPKRAFPDSADLQEFVEFARQHVGRTAE